MPVSIKPTSRIIAKLGLEPNGRIQKAFTNTCYKRMDKYVPYREGNLSSNVTLYDTYVVYEMPYAKYMYDGVSRTTGKDLNYSKVVHPYAGSHWDKRMVSAEMKEIEKEMQDLIRR